MLYLVPTTGATIITDILPANFHSTGPQLFDFVKE